MTNNKIFQHAFASIRVLLVILQEAKNYFKEKFNAPPTFAVCTGGKMGRLLGEQEHSDGFVFPMVSKNVLDESTDDAV